MKSYGLLIAAALAWSTPAAAQMVRAQDPDSVVAALKKGGLPTTLTTDKQGDPMIRTSAKDTNFVVLFYNCTDNKDCATVQFHVGYELTKKVGLDRINEWNRTQRFGRAYLDDVNDPILQMDIDLDDGGMSTALFVDNIEFWTSVVSRFEDHIGYNK